MNNDSSSKIIELSSFRDPSGFVFYKNKNVYRQVNKTYATHYRYFSDSGLKEALISDQLLIKYSPDKRIKLPQEAHIILTAEKIPFISYPYEWSFSQLKDAALTTLTIMRMALDYGMILKDASAYNIQFLKGKPILIDMLSFEKYSEGEPWIGYQQFCQHFLGPLALMSQVDLRYQQYLKSSVDGIPLDFVSKALPKSSYLNFSLFSHIHLHANNQKRFSSKHVSKQKIENRAISKTMLLGIIEDLTHAIGKLECKKSRTQWGDYYQFTNYSSKAFAYKKNLITQYIDLIKPNFVWDFGSNTGEFSRLASNQHIQTISFDIDPVAVDRNYSRVKERAETHILPLMLDLLNASPSLGWAAKERKSLIDRGPTHTVMALALIHHLCITHNISFKMLVDFFAACGQYLIIEFVPKNDTKAQFLVSSKKDIIPWYTQDFFEHEFTKVFSILKKNELRKGSLRTLYLMKLKK